jgi:hypothetical protein
MFALCRGTTTRTTTRPLWVAAIVASGMLGASAAQAAGPPPGSEFGISSARTEVKDSTGADETRAGAHPVSARAEFTLNSYDSHVSVGGRSPILPLEDPKTIITKLPPGFSGNPTVAGTCALAAVPRITGQPMACPVDSMVGFIHLDGATPLSTPIVNVPPERGYPAQFAFSEASLTFALYPELRSDSDYGLNIEVPYANQNFITRVDVTFCSYGVLPTFEAPSSGDSTYRCLQPDESNAFPKPFLTNPATECAAEAPFTDLEIDSWQTPGVFKTARAVSPLITSCETLEFEPSVDIAPTTPQPDAPTGLNVDMTFPQEDNAQGQAPPALKKAVVTLPEGMTINPSGAGGLAACADGELLLKSKDPMTCPDASKVGTVVAKSPLMEEEIKGGVYIRSQNSRDPESGEMFRLALVLQNEKRGIDIRLPGQIRANRQTGRLETTFDNNPELPVSSLKLQFKDGPRAPLATPPTCGPKTVDTVLTSWGKQTKALQSTFTVNCIGGQGSFGLGFQAGTKAPIAGASSPFNLLLTRADAHDVIDGLRIGMPEGLLANLNGNVGTQVGTVLADAGPGTHPYRFPGKVYLEGQYGDAPFSLRVVIPAKAGPFDLGEVVVRQKIYVDPTTAAVTVISDPIPTIVEGVPVRLRNMSVDIDKPGFMINPTSCAPKKIWATATSKGGHVQQMETRFQVGACEKLPVKPKLDIDVIGSKQLGYHKHPGIKATVTQTRGEAGLKKAEVTMPLSLALDPDNAKALCKPVEAAAKACPADSIVGNATAVSPVLNRPLAGHVYFVEGTRVTESGRITATLPKLWVALRGEVALEVWADSDVDSRKRLVTTFAEVPDAPISSFELNIQGGNNGILQVTGKKGAHMCNQRSVAEARFDGQNGKQRRFGTHMDVPCRFRTVSSTLTSRDARVRVTGLEAGRLTVSGPGVRTTRRTIKQSPVATVRARLNATGQRARRAGKNVRVKVTFRPDKKRGEAKRGKTKTTKVTVKPARKTASTRGSSPR